VTEEGQGPDSHPSRQLIAHLQHRRARSRALPRQLRLQLPAEGSRSRRRGRELLPRAERLLQVNERWLRAAAGGGGGDIFGSQSAAARGVRMCYNGVAGGGAQPPLVLFTDSFSHDKAEVTALAGEKEREK
jgi:hypothetical protein